MKKRTRVLASILVSMLICTSCAKGGSKGSKASLAFTVENLKTLDGVKSVETIDSSLPQGVQTQLPDEQNLMLTFEQPLDWANPSAGTFEQRVQVCYQEGRVNEFLVNGYMLLDDNLPMGSTLDSYSRTNSTNLINVEYRFYGKSKPTGLSNTSPKYWNYLTSYNAACDFHHIYTELKKIIPGKWLMTGTSKGGVATMIQSMYFPEDADIYMPQIAPVMDGPQAKGFFSRMYETIGEESFGPDISAGYRQLVLDFQIEAIKNRDALQNKVYDLLIASGNSYTDYATPEIIFDMTVLDFATNVWLYGNVFPRIAETLEKKGEDDYLDALVNTLLSPSGSPINTSGEGQDIFAYYVQCATDLGYYGLDFSYLRAALEKDGSGAHLTVTEDMEDMLFYKVRVVPEVLDTIKYDSSVRDGLIKWSQTTTCQVLLLYGDNDAWYSMRLPDVPNHDNFHTYVAKGVAHEYVLSRLPLSEQIEAKKILNDALAG